MDAAILAAGVISRIQIWGVTRGPAAQLVLLIGGSIALLAGLVMAVADLLAPGIVAALVGIAALFLSGAIAVPGTTWSYYSGLMRIHRRWLTVVHNVPADDPRARAATDRAISKLSGAWSPVALMAEHQSLVDAFSAFRDALEGGGDPRPEGEAVGERMNTIHRLVIGPPRGVAA